jgi:alpha-D-ribose 1-methylphosphonate 5-triphosphate synthase subunit PhnG
MSEGILIALIGAVAAIVAAYLQNRQNNGKSDTKTAVVVLPLARRHTKRSHKKEEQDAGG